MNRKQQAAYGRIGGSKTGPTKRRDVDYSALAKLRWEKQKKREKLNK